MGFQLVWATSCKPYFYSTDNPTSLLRSRATSQWRLQPGQSRSALALPLQHRRPSLQADLLPQRHPHPRLPEVLQLCDLCGLPLIQRQAHNSPEEGLRWEPDHHRGDQLRRDKQHPNPQHKWHGIGQRRESNGDPDLHGADGSLGRKPRRQDREWSP
jgi:hypothetical protein